MTPLAPSRGPRYPEGDPRVLAARQLRNGVALSETAKFSDESWSLVPASLQAGSLQKTLNFAEVPELYRRVLKLVCYTQLSGELPPGDERPALDTITGSYYALRHFFGWLADAGGSPLPANITRVDLQHYSDHLLSTVESEVSRHKHRTATWLLWRYRASLGDVALSFDPRGADFWTDEPYPATRAENVTPRIPEHVHAPLLVWARRFVDDFSNDILSAVKRWSSARTLSLASGGPGNRPAIKRGQARATVERFLEKAILARKPLPGSGGQINRKALSRAIGCSPLSLDGLEDEIDAAVAVLGVSEYADLDIQIRGRLDDEPWIDGICLTSGAPDSLARLTYTLQSACYVLIAFLSGMRDSEVKHLRVGCREAQRDSRGDVMRWLVHSLAFKGERQASGVPATWVIGAPAARAIAVLEDLRRHSGQDSEWLFAPLRMTGGIGSSGRSGNEALTVSGTNAALNRFVQWVNTFCSLRGREDFIPDHDGRPWQLTTRQFRRTLAWYIARRPGGSIAGAIAYRHHSIQMFEGYAGTSDSGFRAEVEAEEALARGEHLVALVEHYDHSDFRGPAADEAYRRLSDIATDGRFAGSVQTDPKRRARLLELHGPEIYPGKYVTCVFTREKARCHANADGPDLPTCVPLGCANVVLTEENVDTWLQELETIRIDLEQRPALPPLLVERLEKRRRDIERLMGGDGA